MQRSRLFSAVNGLAVALFASAVLFGVVMTTDDSNIDDTQMGGAKRGDRLEEILHLSKEQIIERLGHVFDKIDTNGDGFLDGEEVKEWSRRIKGAVQKKQVSLEKQNIDKDGDGYITLEELRMAYMDNEQDPAAEEHMAELQKRFVTVDKNGDGQLDFEEITLLMYPGSDSEILSLEIEEILKIQDKNGDRKIELQEFLSTEEGVTEAENAEFTQEFKNYDSNNDGYIDEDEIKKIVSDPHAHEINQSVTDLMGENLDSKISRDEWNTNWRKNGASTLVDSGELLRFPKDYEDLELPFDNLSNENFSINADDDDEEEEEEGHDEL